MMDIQTHNTESRPYAKELQQTLETQHKMFGLLGTKVNLLKEKAASDDTPQLEKVEAEIAIIRAEGELSVLERVIRFKTKYFDEFMEQFEKDFKEANEKIKGLLVRASHSSNPKVQHILSGDINAILKEPEPMVTLYKQLKKYV